MSLYSIEIGIRCGHDEDNGVWSLGSHVKFPLGFLGGVQFVPSFDFFFGLGEPDWQVNGDVAFRMMMLYVGGGLAIIGREIRDSDKDISSIGYNLFAGIQMPIPGIPVWPFVEARWTYVSDITIPHILLGLNIPLQRGKGY